MPNPTTDNHLRQIMEGPPIRAERSHSLESLSNNSTETAPQENAVQRHADLKKSFEKDG
jgi:hypothetical protein